MLSIRPLPALLLAASLATLAGCGEDSAFVPEPPLYSPQTTPANVLDNLKTAYRLKDIVGYSALFAEDVSFLFDPNTRDREQLPEFWSGLRDYVETDQLFQSPEVKEIRLTFTYSAAQPDDNPDHERWVRIDVVDSFFEIDLVTTSQPDGFTYLFDSGRQTIYFRKGRTEADTLAESSTSSLYYIVEWRNKPVDLRIPTGD